jgi:hypothetical protein
MVGMNGEGHYVRHGKIKGFRRMEEGGSSCLVKFRKTTTVNPVLAPEEFHRAKRASGSGGWRINPLGQTPKRSHRYRSASFRARLMAR